MKSISPLIFIQAVLLIQLGRYVAAESFFSSMGLALLSGGSEMDSSATSGLRRLSLVSPMASDDDESATDDDEAGSTTNVATATGHGGITSSSANDDDFVSTNEDSATNANSTDNSNSTASVNTTESTDNSNSTASVNTTETSNSTSTSNPTEVSSATEVPTLGVDDLISLLDDDSVHNSTAVIPAEKEQPREFAGYVIVIFLLVSIVLFGATCVKQCRKRRTYSEVPTSIVV